MPKDTKRKSAAPTPAQAEAPIVRHGDVLAVMRNEIDAAVSEITRWRRVGERLEAYKAAHPEHAEHLRSFLAGEG